MASFTRALTFQSQNLGKTANLLLTFDQQASPGIYNSYCPTAWKVLEFGSSGDYASTVQFSSNFVFTRTQISADGTVQPASTSININAGQRTILTEEEGAYSFSPPTPTDSGQMVAVNNVSLPQSIGIGFFETSDQVSPSQALVFPNVGYQSEVQCKFTTTLSGYITSDYLQNQVIQSQISSPMVFREELAGLADETTWIVTYDDANGTFDISQGN